MREFLVTEFGDWDYLIFIDIGDTARILVFPALVIIVITGVAIFSKSMLIIA